MVEVGSVEMVQLLDADGFLCEDEVFSPYVRGLSVEVLCGFYRDMVVARRFDQEATALQRQGQLAMWPPSLGQEAAQVGSARAALGQDFLVPSYREHVAAFVRGVDFVNILEVFRGVKHGGWDSFANNFHIYSLVLGAQTLHAVGYGMGLQRDGLVGTGDVGVDSAVMVYFGDGATSQGDVHESMVFAASSNVPVVFFCQNNQWAISVPTQVQSRVPLVRRAYGYGMPGVRVDGNDVLGVFAVTQHALLQARSGGGPFFVEAYTYRMGAHTTADDPTKYRSVEEEKLWSGRDPIVRLGAYLRRGGLVGEDFFVDLEVEVEGLVQDLRKRCVGLGDPPVVSMFDNVYAQKHSLVERERAWFVDYQASFVDDGVVGSVSEGGV